MSNDTILRQRNDTTTRRAEFAGQQVIIKTSQSSGLSALRARLIHLYPPIRAKDSLWLEQENAKRLRAARIPAPDVLSYKSQWQLPFCYQQTLITRYIENAVPLRHYIYADVPPEQKRSWMQHGIDLGLQLHQSGLYHLDFHPENILFQGDKPWLIDCDQVVQCPQPRADLLIRCLGRLSFGMRDDNQTQTFFDTLITPVIAAVNSDTASQSALSALYQQSRNGEIKGGRLRFLYHKGLASYLQRYPTAK